MAKTAAGFKTRLGRRAVGRPERPDLHTPGNNKFNALLAAWRSTGDLAGLGLRSD